MSGEIVKRKIRREMTGKSWTVNGFIILACSAVIYVIFKSVNETYAPIYAAAIAVVANYGVRLSFVEYLYSFDDGDIIVEKLVSKKKRKKPILVISGETLEFLAPEKDERLKEYITGDEIMKYDYSSAITSKFRYFAVYRDPKSEKREVLIFEPDRVMLKEMRKAYPSKVIPGELA